MRLHLLRHTEVSVPRGLCYGRTDVALHADCDAHLDLVRSKVPSDILARAMVWSSPAQRCRRLADSLTGGYQVDARLAEFDFGHWEGRQWDSLPADELEAWNRDLANYTVPQGESLVEVLVRARGFIDEQVRSVDELDQGPGELVVVSHGGVIRALLAHALGMPLQSVFRLQVDYGSVSGMRLASDGWRVLFINR